MYMIEECKPKEYIDNLKSTNKLSNKLLKYLKDGKTEYPHIIKKYFNEIFKVQILDEINKLLEG